MSGPLGSAYRRLQRRYPLAIIVVQFQLAHLVTAAGVLELRLYQSMTTTQFWRAMAVAQALIFVENLAATRLAWRALAGARPWLEGDRTTAAAVTAWRALAELPAEFVRRHRLLPFVTIDLFCAFVVIELGLPWTAFVVLVAGGLVVLMYGATLRILGMELALRPILQEVSEGVPPDVELGAGGLPLRLKLLAGLPMINVISGVTVAGLTADQPNLSDLGFSVVMAVLVAFTVSLWLTLLLARSILRPVTDIREAADRVREGDLDVHVPVTATDETGALAQSFNEMVAGLAERERLQEAFGAYVDPDVASMVIDRGVDLEGQELEVTVLFLDIRDFTAFAERSSARQVVQRLNRFYEMIVPILHRHGGHANKFAGDGLLGVFGAPDRRPDHADRAVAAALEILERVNAQGGFRVGLGLNSGSVVAGTIGGGGRVEFTVIGDVVNTAARVEEVTRETGDDMLITDRTRRLLTAEVGTWVERETEPLKGKRERVRLWALRRPGATEVGAAAQSRGAPA